MKILDRNSRKFRGVLFQSGNKRFFCAGGNLHFYAAQKQKSEGILANRRIRRALKIFSEIDQPKVALVSGDCFGGGLELLSAFDHVISSPQAYFGFWQRRIGLSFGWGGGTRWSEKDNRGNTLKLALEARSICSEEAKNLGLIHQIVLDERLCEQGMKWLNSVIQWPEESLLGLRQWTPSKETKIFENLWNSSSHKMALQRYR